MNRIIQGLALAAFVSAAHAALGDAFPSNGAPLFVTAKQTYADMHAGETKTQTGEAFPGYAPGAGD